MIKALSQQTSEQLCAQQVITSLPDCIKQLVDNAIDAKATQIRILLTQYGKQKVEVMDNGVGISEFDFLGKKGTSSKNRTDQRIQYLGFRGEAVHSIGRVSALMTIQSKSSKDGHRRVFILPKNTLEDYPQDRICHGKFSFHNPNRQGSRNTGTLVTISNLFQNLPVRQLQLQLKAKQFLKKTHQLIREFTLIYPQIQFILLNTRQGKQDTLIQTVCHKQFDRLTWMDRIKEMDQRLGSNLVYVQSNMFEGFVLNRVESGSSRENAFLKKNMHYCYANRRPIDPPTALVSALNDIYKKYNHSTKYAFILNLKLSHQQIDLNLSPNKRQIYIRKTILEDTLEVLKQQINKKVIQEIPTLSKFQQKEGEKQQRRSQRMVINENNPRKSVFIPANSQEVEPNRQKERVSVNRFSSHVGSERNNNPFSSKQTQSKTTNNPFGQQANPFKFNIDRNRLKEQLNSKLNSKLNLSKLNRTSGIPPSNNPPVEPTSSAQLQQARKKVHLDKVRQEEQDARKRAQFNSEMNQVKLQESEIQLLSKANSNSAQRPRPHINKPGLMEQEIKMQAENTSRNQQKEQQINQDQDQQGEMQVNSVSKSRTVDRELQERIKSKISKDMTHIFTNFKKKKQDAQVPNSQPSPLPFDHPSQHEPVEQPEVFVSSQKVSSQPDSQKQAEQPLVALSDSLQSDVRQQLGDLAPKSISKQDFLQFDILGQFNLGFIICHHKGIFYMVDQHAADQKYLFEQNLQRSKKAESISCFQQKPITPIDSDEIQQCHQLLKQAGFSYSIIDNQTLKLQRCPVFKDRKLGMQYFDDIISQRKELQRCKKFSSICATMACRGATKVGDPLGRDEMRRQVNNLAGLAAPWNCPHGRPTLIELGKYNPLTKPIKTPKIYSL